MLTYWQKQERIIHLFPSLMLRSSLDLWLSDQIVFVKQLLGISILIKPGCFFTHYLLQQRLLLLPSSSKKKFKKKINNEKHLGIFGNGDNFLCLPLLYFSVNYLSSSVKLTVHACFSFWRQYGEASGIF